MNAWLDNLLTAIDTALQHGAALSILLGLAIALAGTQWLKFVLLRTSWLPDPRRWIVKTLSLPLGAVTTYTTWPGGQDRGVQVSIALAVGLLAPYVYMLATAILYRIWPDLERRLSADPYLERDG